MNCGPSSLSFIAAIYLDVYTESLRRSDGDLAQSTVANFLSEFA
jgi:hypothetical protein